VYCHGFGSSQADNTALFDKIGGDLDQNGKYDVEYFAPALTAVHSNSQSASPGSSVTELVKNTGAPVSEHQSDRPGTRELGIGVGAGIGGLLVFSLVLFLLWRMWKWRARSLESLDACWGKPELLGSPVDKFKHFKELDSGIVHEMDAQDSRFKISKHSSQAGASLTKTVVEADSDRPVVEAEADRPAVEAPADAETVRDAVQSNVLSCEKS
jgi:hypothetical protein